VQKIVHDYEAGKVVVLAPVHAPTVIAGSRSLRRDEIRKLKGLIQQRLDDVPIELVLRQQTVNVMDEHGLFRSEFSMAKVPTEKEQSTITAIRALAEAALNRQERAFR
jgi:hypothetical protein